MIGLGGAGAEQSYIWSRSLLALVSLQCLDSVEGLLCCQHLPRETGKGLFLHCLQIQCVSHGICGLLWVKLLLAAGCCLKPLC